MVSDGAQKPTGNLSPARAYLLSTGYKK